MFGLFKKLFERKSGNDAASKPNPANPSTGWTFHVALDGPAGKREETINLVEFLADVFSSLGRRHRIENNHIVDVATGAAFYPGIVSFEPRDDLSVQTCTTIEVRNAVRLQAAFFEFQHSTGLTGALSISKGFESWSSVDLPVVLEAFNDAPPAGTSVEVPLPGKGVRRVLFGPIMRVAADSGGDEAGEGCGEAEGHSPFCPCCLFSNCLDAFQSILMQDEFFAIRLYAMRSADGSAQADCRVNGVDFPAGAKALVDYVQKWPASGFEARKQYVLIRTEPGQGAQVS